MKHPFAIVGGQVRRIDEIVAGDEPHCPVTGERLFARALTSHCVSPHFTYGPGSGGCGYGTGWGSDGETYWHALAKRIIQANSELSLPGGEVLGYVSADLEVSVPGTVRRADAHIGPDELFIEFSYSNPKGEPERADYRRARARCLEINILSAGRREMTTEELIDFVLYSAPRRWVFDMETAVREAIAELARRRAERARKRQEAEDLARRETEAVRLEERANAAADISAAASSAAGRLSFLSAAKAFLEAAAHLRRGNLRAHDEALTAAERCFARAEDAELAHAAGVAAREEAERLAKIAQEAAERETAAASQAEREENERKAAAARAALAAQAQKAAELAAWKKTEDEKRARRMAAFEQGAARARASAANHGGEVAQAYLHGAECCERAAEQLASWQTKDDAAYWDEAAKTARREIERLLIKHAAAVSEAEGAHSLDALRDAVRRMTDVMPRAIASRLAELEGIERERQEAARREREAAREADRIAALARQKAREEAEAIERAEAETARRAFLDIRLSSVRVAGWGATPPPEWAWNVARAREEKAALREWDATRSYCPVRLDTLARIDELERLLSLPQRRLRWEMGDRSEFTEAGVR